MATTLNIRLRAGETNPKNIVLRRVLHLAGVTKGSTGAALPFCVTHLFKTTTDLEKDQGLSDAGGAYSFDIHDLDPYYVVATRYSEYRFDSTAYTFDSFDSFPLTFDVQQVDGTTANNRKGE